MFDRHCGGTARPERLRVGPLCSHIDRFATFLAADGYAVSTVGFELEAVKKYIPDQEQFDQDGRF